MTTETPNAENTLRLERETCSRCGGSGTYSYCQRYGTVCFKCAGRKEVLTKRGHAASLYLESLRSRAASELKPGDQVKCDAMTMGGDMFAAWFTVESIEPDDTQIRSFVGNVEQPRRTDLLKIKLTSKKAGPLTCSACPPERTFRIALTKEQQLDTLKQAIAYQATLTKSGQPRKR